LSIWRSQIETYARQQRLIWHQDATNSDVKYTRNRLRHNVLPYLRQEISPQVDKALWRAAEILRGEQEWLERLVGPLARLDRLPVAKLRIQPLAKVRRILKQWLQHQGIRDVGFDEVEKVRSLLHQDKPAKVNLPGQRHARRRSGWLFLE
jgi:tRNA(Ile)-lysidine synthase